MVKYRVTEIAGHARVEPVGAPGSVDVSAHLARAEVERAEQIAKIVVDAAHWVVAGLAGLWRRYRAAQTKRTAIAQLARLDNQLLRDIGLERYEIAAAVDGLLSQGTVAGSSAANENRSHTPRGLTDAA